MLAILQMWALTHCGPVVPYGVDELSHHWFMQRLVANWILRTRLQWILNHNTKLNLFLGNGCKNVLAKWWQCVNQAVFWGVLTTCIGELGGKSESQMLQGPFHLRFFGHIWIYFNWKCFCTIQFMTIVATKFCWEHDSASHTMYNFFSENENCWQWH